MQRGLTVGTTNKADMKRVILADDDSEGSDAFEILTDQSEDELNQSNPIENSNHSPTHEDLRRSPRMSSSPHKDTDQSAVSASTVPPTKAAHSIVQSPKKRKAELPDPSGQKKRLKLLGSDQEIVVDTKRLVKYTDVDKIDASQASATPAPARGPVPDYSDF